MNKHTRDQKAWETMSAKDPKVKKSKGGAVWEHRKLETSDTHGDRH